MPEQRRAVGWAILLLVGCGGPPAHERCWTIYTDELLGEDRVRNRAYTLDRLHRWRDQIGPDSMDRLTAAVPGAVVRQAAASIDPHSDYQGGDVESDSAWDGRAALHLRHDSLVRKVSPPPRPSELRWYEEHCYRGQPR